MTYILIAPAAAQRQAFALWCLAQDPPIPTATAFGSNVPTGLFGSVPDEILDGALIDGHVFRPVVEGFEPDGLGYREAPAAVVVPVDDGAKPEPVPTPAPARRRKTRTQTEVTE